MSTMQLMNIDKEKPRKPKDVKHVALAIDKVKVATAPPNYNKPKP